MNRKKDMIKIIMNLSGSRSPYDIFCDWTACCALSIQNSMDLFHGNVYRQREEQYMQIIGRYDRKEVKHFPELLAMLCETLEDEMSDVLGEIYMESGMGNKNTGQFFTPFHVSVAAAKMILPNDQDRITLNEPSCGGGGMIIAAARVLKERGIDYQRKLEVVAQDLDWKGVYMCYVQLSLLGIRATVVQGNTLLHPYLAGKTDPIRIFRTPAKMGLLIL